MRSDSDTDDEGNPKKQVPKWAEGTQLRTALLKQCYMGPYVDKIFYPIEDPDLSVMFNQQKKDTSSEQAVLAGTQRHSRSTSNEFRKKFLQIRSKTLRST